MAYSYRRFAEANKNIFEPNPKSLKKHLQIIIECGNIVQRSRGWGKLPSPRLVRKY